MPKLSKNFSVHALTPKRTKQGGTKPKTSSMNRHEKRSYKRYRGQGK